MKKQRGKDGMGSRVIALTGAIALGLTPMAATAGRVPAIDRQPEGRRETATFALG